MKPVIKIKLLEEPRTKSKAYRLIGSVLSDLGGRDQHIDRREVVKAVKESPQGRDQKNIDAAVSSFCALPCSDAIVQHDDGRIEPFVSRRLLQTRKAPRVRGVPGPESDLNS